MSPLAAEPLRVAPMEFMPRETKVCELKVRSVAGRTSAPPADAFGMDGLDTIISRSSPEMSQLMEQVRRVAPQETNILLEGETGTGKTRLARIIHELSSRRDEPFLVINCGALSEHLIESEMFGHVRGSFTGADRDRVGKFAEVGRGTLLLDEIDTLPLALQAKLLRAVEERSFEPVGSNQSLPMQARLIAATSRPLDREVAVGRFRADLYFRLKVVDFAMPPLRDRRSAIRPLAARFILEYASRNGRPVGGITPDALRLLEAYHWPGNIRELRNVIERAVSLSLGWEIQVSDLPETLRSLAEQTPTLASFQPVVAGKPAAPSAPSSLSQIREEAEYARIVEALKQHRDNRLRAAQELGISRMTLYKKLHKYGLMRELREENQQIPARLHAPRELVGAVPASAAG